MKKRNKRSFLIIGVLLLAGVLNLGMSPRHMGPGMMRSSDVFVDNEFEYLVHMIPHHQEAIDNAEILKENTEREEMRNFAEDIIRTQSEEIELMENFLNEWYPDENYEVRYEPMMGNYENLIGNELDQAFLEDMIPHHMEAVMMSQQLLMRELVEHEEVANLAENIRNSQRDEIFKMEEWLFDWDNDSSESFRDNDSSWMSWDNNSRGMMGRTQWPTVLLGAGFIVIAVILVVVILLNRNTNNKDAKSSTNNSAKDLLDMRLAKGDISEEEYQKRRKHLED